MGAEEQVNEGGSREPGRAGGRVAQVAPKTAPAIETVFTDAPLLPLLPPPPTTPPLQARDWTAGVSESLLAPWGLGGADCAVTCANTKVRPGTACVSSQALRFRPLLPAFACCL